jgi:magnesium chelatase family protein
LAKSIVSILPELEEGERLELTKIYSLAGLLTKEAPIVFQRPFRSPHHTTSSVAIIGGGAYPKPGEVSLADKGVLFLDEFPEFPRSVLEALRQPLEDKVVTVSRAQSTLKFPADFILVAAKNPCPCGFFGDDVHECTCPMTKVLNYNRKISGPLLDRIDLHLYVERIPLKSMSEGKKEESSKAVRHRVQSARQIQIQRSVKLLGKQKTNGLLSKNELEKLAPLPQEAKDLLEDAVEKLSLSMRGYLKIWRLARTIADLENKPTLNTAHIAEALQYRAKKEN